MCFPFPVRGWDGRIAGGFYRNGSGWLGSVALVLGLVLVFFLSVNTFHSLPIRVYFLFLYLALFADYHLVMAQHLLSLTQSDYSAVVYSVAG